VTDFDESMENAEMRFKNAHPDEKWNITWQRVQVKDFEATLDGPLGSKSTGVAKGLGDMTESILEALESLRHAIISSRPAQDMTVTSSD
jgi:hypothetical protein